MKLLNILTTVFVCTLLLGCGDEKMPSQNGDEIMHVTLKNTEIYNYDLGSIGIEEGGSLLIEPQHASVSTLSRDSESHLIYSYQSESGFAGTDKVQIEICHSVGSGCSATELVTIHFTIMN